MNLHLMAAGTFTGDMFIAAGLDAFPHFEGRVLAAVDALDALYPVSLSLELHADYETTGRRLSIEPFDKYFGRIPHAFADGAANWSSIRQRLDAAQISPCTRTHAHNLLHLICRSESLRQGVAPERVVFEETAGWKTLAKVAGAAALIEALQPAHWSASPFPAGGAEAAGSAIIEYLCPDDARGQPIPRARLTRSGAGYGADSNSVLRLLCFEGGNEAAAIERDESQSQPRRSAAGERANY
jgi:uncharacterized protein (DUF111 family)